MLLVSICAVGLATIQRCSYHCKAVLINVLYYKCGPDIIKAPHIMFVCKTRKDFKRHAKGDVQRLWPWYRRQSLQKYYKKTSEMVDMVQTDNCQDTAGILQGIDKDCGHDPEDCQTENILQKIVRDCKLTTGDTQSLQTCNRR